MMSGCGSSDRGGPQNGQTELCKMMAFIQIKPCGDG